MKESRQPPPPPPQPPWVMVPASPLTHPRAATSLKKELASQTKKTGARSHVSPGQHPVVAYPLSPETNLHSCQKALSGQ